MRRRRPVGSQSVGFIVSLTIVFTIFMQGGIQESPLIKCSDCKTNTKKRIAIMPVEIGQFSEQLNLTEATLADLVVDNLENILLKSQVLHSLNRADLAYILKAQNLDMASLAADGLSTTVRNAIPAQFLLFFSVKQLQIETKTISDKNSEVERLTRQAIGKENEAAILNGRTIDAGDTMKRLAQLDKMRQDLNIDLPKSKSIASITAVVGNVLTTLSEVKKARKKKKTSMLMMEAAQLRLQAESIKNNISQKMMDANIEIGWEVMDTTSGLVLGSGQEKQWDCLVEKIKPNISTVNAEESDSADRLLLLKNLSSMALQESLSDLEEKVVEKPLKAKVVKSMDNETVILNAGKNYGVSEGDTFGVRKKGEELTDPDTGLTLSTSSPLIGKIRVYRVDSQLSYARAYHVNTTIERGDELEWIGMYNLDPTVEYTPVKPDTETKDEAIHKSTVNESSAQKSRAATVQESASLKLPAQAQVQEKKLLPPAQSVIDFSNLIAADSNKTISLDQSIEAWAKWMDSFKRSIKRAEELELRADISAETKRKIWELIAATFPDENQYTDEDNQLREYVKAKIDYYKHR